MKGIDKAFIDWIVESDGTPAAGPPSYFHYMQLAFKAGAKWQKAQGKEVARPGTPETTPNAAKAPEGES